MDVCMPSDAFCVNIAFSYTVQRVCPIARTPVTAYTPTRDMLFILPMDQYSAPSAPVM